MTAENAKNTGIQVATLGGGCFWCLEAVFDHLMGVELVESGYSGGASSEPTYQQVCAGNTGHAEVVRVTFDPAQVSFEDILDVFFTLHNPTTLNRQGADVGTQYRSVIFYHSEEQKEAAEKKIAEFEGAGIWPGKMVTEVTAAPVFFKAEDYHQGYYRDNPYQGYCQAVISPKLAKLRQKFAARLKA